MLQAAANLKGYSIEAKDGNVGHIYTFLFEDSTWIVRYVVIGTGGWFSEKKVLLTPTSLGKADFHLRNFSVELSREQVKGSPEIEAHEPVSRQKEKELASYYGWVPYWGHPLGSVDVVYQRPDVEQGGAEAEQHLRSTKEVKGYEIRAEDGRIGHIEDFIFDEDSWTIRYLVVDTGEWLSGKQVLIPPAWIKDISWSDAAVEVKATREQVEKSPVYDPTSPVNREYEIRFYDYYGRGVYWVES
jgi:sporulation protein YlmC with PRC-barrel domain